MDHVLLTSRLRLVPQRARDVDALLAFYRQPGVRRFLLDDAVVERDWVAETVARSEADFARGGWGLWRADDRVDGALVGIAGLLRMDGDDAEPELIYALDDSRRGRGFATEMARAVVAHAFTACGFTRVLASTDAPNRDSLRVMERLGMTVPEVSPPGARPGRPFRVLDRAHWRTRT